MPRIVGGRYGLVVEGVHAGDGQGGLRQPGGADAEESLHGRHQRRRVAHQPRVRPGVRHPRQRTSSVACSTASARTERLARTRTRSRSSARRRPGTRRASSSTTRRSQDRGRRRTCGSGRGRFDRPTSCSVPASWPVTSSSSSSRSRCCARPIDGAVFLLNSPFGPDRVWDELPRSMQEDLIRKRIRLYVIDADAVAADAGMAGRINTIMQTCFFAISGVLPREEAIAQDQGRDPGDIRPQRAASSSSRISPRSTGRSSICSRCRCLRQPTQHPPAPACRAAGGAGVRQAGDRDDDGGPRRRTAGQRDAAGRHVSVCARRGGRSATSRTPCRSGKPDDLHPMWQLRDGVSALGHPGSLLRRVRAGGGARRDLRPPDWQAVAFRICASRCRWLSKTAPAASCASKSARRKASKPPGSVRSTWTPKAPLLERERANLAFFETLPENVPAKSRCFARQGRPVSDAAVRILGRLCRLRRNAVPAPAQSTFRRPAPRGERDRLFLHLWRQPPDDAVGGECRRTRTRMGQFVVRGQRGIRAWLSTVARQTSRAGGGTAGGARTPARNSARGRDHRRAAGRRRTTWTHSASVSRCSTSSSRRCDRPAAGLCEPCPNTWCGAASGSSEAMAGRTTSGTADWITCWPRAAT